MGKCRYDLSEDCYNKDCLNCVLNKIRTEIITCLDALDEIEKFGDNYMLPNELLGRKLTYKQCLDFIDKYRIKEMEKND